MSRSKIIIVLGIFVALLPFLGFPSSWEAVFQVLIGLSLVGVSIWSNIDKKLTQKAKAQKRMAKKTEEERIINEQKNSASEEINNFESEFRGE